MPMEQEVMAIYAATQGHMDDVPVNRIQEFQNGLLQYIDTSANQLRQDLATKKELTAEIESALKQAITDFKAKVWKK
jgi:F-type H+/Na+-transporting ATPase subunit alpha